MSERAESLFLLDTHVWLWFLTGHERLARSKELKTLESAAEKGWLRVSVMSVWELGMLEARGRIALDRPVGSWVAASIDETGIIPLPLDPAPALESSRLPGEFHGDPVDRILVATARHHDAVLVTADQKILAYAEKRFLRVLPIR